MRKFIAVILMTITMVMSAFSYERHVMDYNNLQWHLEETDELTVESTENFTSLLERMSINRFGDCYVGDLDGTDIKDFRAEFDRETKILFLFYFVDDHKIMEQYEFSDSEYVYLCVRIYGSDRAKAVYGFNESNDKLKK